MEDIIVGKKKTKIDVDPYGNLTINVAEGELMIQLTDVVLQQMRREAVDALLVSTANLKNLPSNLMTNKLYNTIPQTQQV